MYNNYNINYDNNYQNNNYQNPYNNEPIRRRLFENNNFINIKSSFNPNNIKKNNVLVWKSQKNNPVGAIVNSENLINSNNKKSKRIKIRNVESLVNGKLIKTLRNVSVNAKNLKIVDFLDACILNNLALVKKFLKNPNIDINMQAFNIYGDTPLLTLIRYKKKNNNVIKLLLSQSKIDINKHNSEGTTPLIMAIKQNDLSIINLLLNHKNSDDILDLDINKTDYKERTPFLLACKLGNIDIVNILLKNDINNIIDINHNNIHGNTPLILAAKYEHFSVIKKLLEFKNIDINKTNNDNECALEWTCFNQNEDIFNILIENKNIDINIKSISTGTPFTSSFITGFTHGIDILLDKKCLLYFVDNHPFHSSDISEEYLEKVTKYFEKLLSNYDFLKIYIDENKLEDYNFEVHFENIYNYLELNYSLQSIIIFIYKFIKSIPKNSDIKVLNNYTKFIYSYLKITHEFLATSNNRNYNEQRYTIRINNNEELKTILELINNPNEDNIKNIKLRVIYLNGRGSNAGGLTRQFFTNLELQLNKRFKDIDEISRKILSNIQIAKLTKKNINQNKHKNLEEQKKKLLISDANLYTILAISKLNNNPIFIDNKTLKVNILNKISKLLLLNKIKKNIIYNYLSSLDNEIIDKKFSISNNNYNNNYEQNINYLFNKLNTNNNKVINTDTNNLDYLNTNYISKYYIDFFDFYICHLLNFSISKELFLSRLIFENNSANINSERFKSFADKFIIMLKSLSQEELILFNIYISGSSILQPNYKIQISDSIGNSVDFPHTCFNTLEIGNIDLFEELYLINNNKKNNFVKYFSSSTNFTKA